jgi:peptidyl-dipeptidase Dcp
MTDFSAPENNPLLRPSQQAYGAPEFGLIQPEHYLPAMKVAVKVAEANLAAIRENPAPPTFENTIEALEYASDLSGDVFGIFFNMTWAASNADIRAIENEMTGLSAGLASAIQLDGDIFARVKAVYDQRDQLSLNGEQKRLLEKTYEGFSMNGALLDADKKAVLRDIDKRLAELSATFNSNIIEAFGAYGRIVDNEEDLAGVPDRVKKSLQAAAEEAGHPGKWMISIGSAGEILTYAENRALRERNLPRQCDGERGRRLR